MNFTNLNLDLQSVLKRTYANLLYRSTFMNFLNSAYLGDIRQTGTPIIEVVKQANTTLNVRAQAEMLTPDTPTLATYSSVMVNLTELAMDYSFRISPVIMGANIADTLEGQMALKDAQVANQIDVYGYTKFNTTIVGPSDGSLATTNGQCVVWAPAAQQDYINLLNTLRAYLFNRNIFDTYLLGLDAVEYANYVSALTSILKYETEAGVEGVDRGQIARAYGIDAFAINSNSLKGTGVKGYFANEVGTVGDTYFSAMQEYMGNYPGFPGYFVLEGNILFGAKVVRPEAIIKLVATLPVLTAGSFDAGTHGTAYTQATAFSGTNSVTFTAVGLPAGLTLGTSTGKITGTPTTAGSYSVAVYGIDANGDYSLARTGSIVIA